MGSDWLVSVGEGMVVAELRLIGEGVEDI